MRCIHVYDISCNSGHITHRMADESLHDCYARVYQRAYENASWQVRIDACHYIAVPGPDEYRIEGLHLRFHKLTGVLVENFPGEEGCQHISFHLRSIHLAEV